MEVFETNGCCLVVCIRYRFAPNALECSHAVDVDANVAI